MSKELVPAAVDQSGNIAANAEVRMRQKSAEYFRFDGDSVHEQRTAMLLAPLIQTGFHLSGGNQLELSATDLERRDLRNWTMRYAACKSRVSHELDLVTAHTISTQTALTDCKW